MKYYMIPKDKDLNKYKEEIILPLLSFSASFDTYFSKEEIISISKERNVSVIINTFMHKNDLNSIKEVIDSLKDYVKYFFIEDLGLINLIDKDKIVLYQNHIINNYEAINYFKEIGINNIVINNDLTIEEIKEIDDKTNSNLFIFGINKNTLMYSKRKLVSSYFNYKGINDYNKTNIIKEDISKKELIIKEEDKGTCILNKEIFAINNFLDVYNNFNVIVNFSNTSEEEENIILKYYNSKDLSNYLNIDDYFLKNKIIYKLGVK